MPMQNSFPAIVSQVANRIGAAVAEVHLGRFGLSRDEWRVLTAIGKAEGEPTRAVAEMTGLDKVAISRAATALEDAGLIDRREDRDDRRIKILHLTRRGREILEAILEQMSARERFLLDGLDPLERSLLERILAKIGARAEALASGEVDPDMDGRLAFDGVVAERAPQSQNG
ncbi:MAG: MarR family transcriptional regulator [Pseudomonadota bacterium]